MDGCRLTRAVERPHKELVAGFERWASHLDDELVLWGWDPGVGRTPVDIPHKQFVAAFERWAAAGAPCPAP